MSNSKAEHEGKRWSAAKTTFLLLLPSIIFIVFGMLSLTTLPEVFLFVPLYLCPLLALVLAILATREFAKNFHGAEAYIAWGALWIIAHAGVLVFVGFGGCSLISVSMGY